MATEVQAATKAASPWGVRGVEIVPCLQDNYAYLLPLDANEVVVIDASETAPILRALGDRHVRAVLSTHHHPDHVGANEALRARFPGLRIYAHASEVARVPAQTERLAHEDSFELGAWRFTALHVPGHTAGALAYVGNAPSGESCAFTGDTLFSFGAGRLFEGTAAQMWRSLSLLMERLAPDARVYPGHEYTAQNLRFAASVDSGNRHVHTLLEQVASLLSDGRASIPTLFEQERVANPFLRVDDAGLRAQLGVSSTLANDEVFARIREAKNQFRG